MNPNRTRMPKGMRTSIAIESEIELIQIQRAPCPQVLSRRGAVGGILSAGALILVGCSRRKATQEAGQPAASSAPENVVPAAAMVVHRDPSCGCCEAWSALARNAGYAVTLKDEPDMAAIKRQYFVPEELASCHTAVLGGYAIEGHVPFDDVARLLREKPANIVGIAVPGMPRGSPGMEMPDGSKDHFQVSAFDRAGRVSVWNA